MNPNSSALPPHSAHPDPDANAPARKQDHIELAFRSQVGQAHLDARFDYEPLLAAHPTDPLPPLEFLGYSLAAPLWISSMTGGTQMAGTINHNLARACGEFGFGMGLGSCRSLLYANTYFDDFNVRPLLGKKVPLYANLGVAQVDKLLVNNELSVLTDLVGRLQADGLIVHVNPTQEWLQPEGDQLLRPPLAVLDELLARTSLSIIVKEVGQGFGPASMRALLQMPLAAVDFAAGGGTNFALLELLRSDPSRRDAYEPLSRVGHTAEEMMRQANQIAAELRASGTLRCQQLIISGGVKDFLDGYYLTASSTLPAIYGQASAFLRHAREGYEPLRQYVGLQLQGLAYARAYLRLRA
ncbi:MAG: isopentenyl-diphosphate delta-isomerase [Bernardetiaceae bacterium]|jgi:isopentenyl-diphosphate delta-isomerase|nr:isopentenyl-diphosphate delta-isomerase [Bernardetiaceae bacterium]